MTSAVQPRNIAILASSFFTVLAFIAIAPVAGAADSSPSPAPSPVAQATRVDFSSMMFQTGTWNCSQPARGSQRPDTQVTRVGTNGMWMITEDTAPPFDKYRSFTIKGTDYMTYDTSIKKWVTVSVDDYGGYGLSTADAWNGNTLTWTFKTLDGSAGTDVLTKLSDTETTDDISGTDAQGKPYPKYTITCKKVAG